MAKDTIRIIKLDEARRQLRTAITLWFNGGDPVAIHTLAFGAYEILHHLSEKRDPSRRDLIFGTLTVRDQFRRDWNQRVRKEANFFKHADRDGDSVIEFNPAFTEHFILFAIVARRLCGEPEAMKKPHSSGGCMSIGRKSWQGGGRTSSRTASQWTMSNSSGGCRRTSFSPPFCRCHQRAGAAFRSPPRLVPQPIRAG
ncbi:hypothetical protein [Bradyrhizobium sp. USDA 4506]